MCFLKIKSLQLGVPGFMDVPLFRPQLGQHQQMAFVLLKQAVYALLQTNGRGCDAKKEGKGKLQLVV